MAVEDDPLGKPHKPAFENLVEAEFSRLGRPLVIESQGRSDMTVKERLLITRGLVGRVNATNVLTGEVHQYTADNLPPVPPNMPIMTTDEAMTMRFSRPPQSPEDCAKYLSYRLQRPIAISSIGCGRATIEKNLLASGLASSVTGVEIDPNSSETSSFSEGKFSRVDVSSNGKSSDELREEVCAHIDGADLVILGDSLHHTDNPFAYIRECFDRLEPGRYIYISEPFDVPGDTRTRDTLFPDDSTAFPNSMLSLADHEIWHNWVLLRGGTIVHAQAVPGYVAGDSDDYDRSKPVLSEPVASAVYGANVRQLAGGTLTQLADSYNRLRTVVETPFCSAPPFTTPAQYRLEENIGLNAFPFNLLNEVQKAKFLANGKIDPENFKDLNPSQVRRAFIAAFRPELMQNFEAYCAQKTVFKDQLPKYADKFGHDEKITKDREEETEIHTTVIILKEIFGIDIIDRLQKLCLNWRGFTPWSWKNGLYDPYQILASPEIGLGTHYEHPPVAPERVGEIVNTLIQRENRKAPHIYSFRVPKQNLPEKPLEKDEEIFKVWPLNIVRREDRQRVLEALWKEEGKGFLESRGVLAFSGPADFGSTIMEVGMALSRGDFTDKNTGIFDTKGFATAWMESMKTYSPGNRILPMGGFIPVDRRESVPERMEDAAEVIYLAVLLSKKCKLGYVIDMISKEAGWETTPICAHPEQFKRALTIPVMYL